MAPIADTPPQTVERIFERQLPTALALRSSSARDRTLKIERFRAALLDRRHALYEAFGADLGKPAMEVDLTELLPVIEEAQHAMAKLHAWMRPRRVAPTLTTLGSPARVLYQPRGRCLIVGPWNYPVNTLLGPLVSAIAAGNTVVLKPSELTPHVNAVIGEVVAEVFDPSEVAMVHGGIETAQHLLSLPFDHVFFTGSPAVGKVVMAAAARHLTSVTLELGGKSPVIVDRTADLKLAAELTMWGKLVNAGQSCVAPDHVYVHRSVHEPFVRLCREFVEQRYGATSADLARNPDFGRMISQRHAARVATLIDDAVARGATVAVGGEHDTARRYVAPTVLAGVPAGAQLHDDEIFGPVLPVEPYDDLEQVIASINAAPKPLALYLWSKDREVVTRFTQQTSSGGMCINHCMQQYAHANLPFGGVNHSGIGSAHGYFGFKAFSHERACLRAGWWMPLKAFFPPYTPLKRSLLGALIGWLRRF